MNIRPVEDAHIYPCLDKLSWREQQVFLDIACAVTPRDTALRLKINPKTVSTYRERMLKKLRLTCAAQCTAYAAYHGLLKIEMDQLADSRPRSRLHQEQAL